MKTFVRISFLILIVTFLSCKSTDNPISGMPVQKIYLDDTINEFVVIKIDRTPSTTLPVFRYTTESRYGFAILNLNEKYNLKDTIKLKIEK